MTASDGWLRYSVLLSSMLLSAVAAAQPFPNHGPASAAVPAVVYSRQASFSIPFKIEGNVAGQPPTVEVQLHVSDDQGRTWRRAAQATPDQARFAFQAPRDGEYWFCVRTIDRAGKTRPEAPLAPELRVAVDTSPPAIELNAERGEAGEMVARWLVRDIHLKRETLRLSYQRLGTDSAWQPVAIDPLRLQVATDALRGETTWWPDLATGAVMVRAEAADAAGNRSTQQVEVAATRQAWRPPLADTLPAAELVRPTRREPGREQLPGFPSESIAPGPAAPPTVERTFPVSTLGNPTLPLNGATASSLPNGNLPTGEPIGPGLGAKPSDMTTTRPVNPPAIVPSAERRSAAVETLPEPAPSSSPLPNPPLSTPEMFAGQPIPAGVRPRMVRRRRFELEYDIDTVGPEGISKIELWVTRDQGLNWDLLTVDEDNRSPIVVNVDGEGLFGFRIVVETGTGLRSPLPRSGEFPELWVGVDTTAPVARWLVEQRPADARPGELALTWEARDERLAARPISLSFSAQAQGPWTTIAAGLENTGRYDWRLDNRAPDQLYLRLEVRDEAGNVTTIETPQPISIDRVRPQGRILNVRPVDDSGR